MQEGRKQAELEKGRKSRMKEKKKNRKGRKN